MTGSENPTYVEYPEYYDFAHSQTQDVPFYLDYARECGSPILELACGTGRLVVPLARAGHRITGVDLSPGMLAICRQRVESLRFADRVSLVQADMTGFDVPEKKFALAFVALRSFAHLFRQKDQLACLKRTHEHLRPGGLLIIAVFALNHRVVAQDEEGAFAVLKQFDLPDTRHVIQWQRFLRYDPCDQIIHFEFKFEEHDRTGLLLRERIVPMTLRYTSRYELQLLLERVDFEVVDVFRDYDKHPYSGKYEIIMVARKARHGY